MDGKADGIQAVLWRGVRVKSTLGSMCLTMIPQNFRGETAGNPKQQGSEVKPCFLFGYGDVLAKLGSFQTERRVFVQSPLC